MTISFLDRYSQCEKWHEKVMVMELYHLAMGQRIRPWTLIKTAEYFEVSIGLVSENLRLALAIHTNEAILNCESRQDALRRMNNGRKVETY